MADSTQATIQLVIDTIRTLSMDAVQAANSGHPGTPLDLAGPPAYSSILPRCGNAPIVASTTDNSRVATRRGKVYPCHA